MRLGVMCSGNGSNFEHIIRSVTKHEVVLMIHNKKECGAIKRAEKFGIPHCYVNAKDEEKMVELFRVWRVDYIILAGYMRIIKNPSAFHCPLINVHPSLLPKYKGLHAVEQALESGDKVTGCTVHYVNEELDCGDVILQSEVPILPEDDVKSLTKAIQRKEYAILPIVINEHLEKLQASIA